MVANYQTTGETMTNLKLLGDPHLGRVFLAGVPLHRRGEREAMVWKDFEKSFRSMKDIKVHVCMGDLFDKSFVPYGVILRAAQIYKAAARKFPDTTFVILKGNHDWLRDLTAPSAFDVFAELVFGVKNIHVVDNMSFIHGRLFIAWVPTADEGRYDDLDQWKGNVTEAFGHWDIMDLADGNINLIPTKKLAEIGIKKIYNGHIHKPKTFTRDGVEVVLTGSMQPYAHGEEINDDLYITFPSLEDLETTELDLRHRVVRVVLSEGETVSDDLDCLHLTIVRSSESDSDDVGDVDLGDFDMESVFVKSMSEAGVSKSITSRLLDKYHSERAASGV